MIIAEQKIEKGFILRLNDRGRWIFSLRSYKNSNGKVAKVIEEKNIKFASVELSLHESVIEELSEIWYIVFDNPKIKVESLYKLKNLKGINVINDYKETDFDFSIIPNLREIKMTWNPNLKFKSVNNIEYLELHHFDGALADLELPKSLKVLKLRGGRIRDIEGLSELDSLKSLEISYSRTLQNFGEIGKLTDLEHLHLQNCSKLDEIKFIKNLKKLNHLTLWACKKIKSYNPIYSLKKLNKLVAHQMPNVDLIDSYSNKMGLKTVGTKYENYILVLEELYQKELL